MYFHIRHQVLFPMLNLSLTSSLSVYHFTTTSTVIGLVAFSPLASSTHLHFKVPKSDLSSLSLPLHYHFNSD